MDRVLIHVGFHKAASTWLQNELFTPTNAVFEPLSLTDKTPCTLASHFVSGPDQYLLSPFDLNESVIREQLQEIRNMRPGLAQKIAVLSHERLSGNPHSSGFDAEVIARRLCNIFPSAKILIVIREQNSFILSNYFQYLSIGGTHSLKKYLDTKYDGKRPGFSPHHVNYLPLVNRYRLLFGEDNVQVLPYELFQSQPESFISVLGALVGSDIPVDAESFIRKANETVNHSNRYRLRSLGRFAVSSSVNNGSGWDGAAMQYFSELAFTVVNSCIPEAANKRLIEDLHQQVSIWSARRYAQSNGELSRLTGLDLAGFGYTCG